MAVRVGTRGLGRAPRGRLLQTALLCAAWTVALALPPPELDYQQYLPDYSYLQRDHPCSPEERACFAYGRLLHAADGKCYRVGESGPCARNETFHAHKAEAQREDGRFVGVCAQLCPDAFHVRLAATGQCISRADHESTVCPRRRGLRASISVFGEAECVCEGPSCVRPPPPPQHAPYAGRCTAPDLRHATPAPSYRLHLQGLAPPCSVAEHECLQRGRVLVQGECHELRKRGPCAPAEWLVLDGKALRSSGIDAAFGGGGRIRPICEPRPCAAGTVPLASDRRCHSLEELRTKLCAGEHLLYDVLGFVGCSREVPQVQELPTRRNSDGRCTMVTGGVQFSITTNIGNTPCAKTDGGECAKAVQAVSPPFVLLPEDD